jgi:protein phosphatase
MKLVAWGKSDTGRKRDHNEDNYLVDGELHLFAVADGMGGHQGGDTASQLALNVLEREVRAAAVDMTKRAEELEEARRDFMLRGTQPVEHTEEITDEPTQLGRKFGRADTMPEPDDETEPQIEAIQPPATVVMRAAAVEAGAAIFDTALADATLRGMGTTLTALLYHTGRMHLVHAGDSRAYLFREGKLQQLTDDHSWIAEQVKAGAMTEAEAKVSQFRHIITRSVGFEREVEVDTRGIGVEAGDCYLLCSDGMSNYVENKELEKILASTWYRRAPEVLIGLANDRGGDDNITVIVVYVANDTSP